MSTVGSNVAKLAALCGLVWLAGCAAHKECAWVPQPVVHWGDLSAVPVESVENGYVLLAPQGSVGRFPASVAVSRVAVKLDEAVEGARRPYLPPKPKNEFLQWNNALDDQMAISEVFPIARRDLGGGDATPVQIVAAFRALRAELGLIYAYNRLSPTESEMIGVLYDAEGSTPLAAIHAREASLIPAEEDRASPEDPWDYDSRALVKEEFRRLVHACVRELVLNDQPGTEHLPEGWTPAGPVRPVEWPPRPFGQ